MGWEVHSITHPARHSGGHNVGRHSRWGEWWYLGTAIYPRGASDGQVDLPSSSITQPRREKTPNQDLASHGKSLAKNMESNHCPESQNIHVKVDLKLNKHLTKYFSDGYKYRFGVPYLWGIENERAPNLRLSMEPRNLFIYPKSQDWSIWDYRNWGMDDWKDEWTTHPLPKTRYKMD